MHPLVFIQYKFDWDEYEVQNDPHGNTNGISAPYHRTMATTKERLQSIAFTTTKPSPSILKDTEKAGGIKNVKLSGVIARNVRQVKYYRVCGRA